MRHGLNVGFSPADLAVHRYLWSGLALLPVVVRAGIGDLNGIGWGRGILLTLLGGPVFAIIGYAGFLFVPLGHGGVIQPSCGALGGLLLATLVLREKLIASRLIGALIITSGLVVIGGEGAVTFGEQGVAGDLLFVLAGFMSAGFEHAAPVVAGRSNAGCGNNGRAVIIRDARLLVALRPCPHGLVGMARKSTSSSIAGRVSGATSFIFICQLDRSHWSWAGSHIFLAGATIRAAHRMAYSRRGAESPSINRVDNRVIWIPPNAERMKMQDLTRRRTLFPILSQARGCFR